jgi:predicted acylesterase/phospholipase RssA
VNEPPFRIGLALSGGGFRAAFFHAGVLIRLAQLDLLRHVTTLSCVSGGSIAGSVYYLSLLRILGWPADQLRPELLTAADCAAAAATTREALLRIRRRNVRARVFANPIKNLTMFLSPRYSRTDRAGDMLDLFLREELHIPTGLREHRIPIARQIELRQLDVQRADLPRLVLNATSLNSGHNWRFRPEGMGEEEAAERTRRDIDRNDRFEWRRFGEIAEDQRDFPLGLAIAASAAFPGLFRPLPITRLFAGYRVDLMDGGAQDNQGVQPFLDAPKSIDLLIVSDGSAQLADEVKRGRLLPSVVFRVIGVQGDRIREEQLLRARSGPLLSLIHLRRGIDARILRPRELESEPEAPPTELTGFGVRRDVQRLLAGVRTDLDTFSHLEAIALALDGYRIAATECARPPLDAAAGDRDESWAHPTVRPLLADPDRRLLTHLGAARAHVGKTLRVRGRPLPFWAALSALAAGVALVVGRALPDREAFSLLVGLGVVLLPVLLARLTFALGEGRWPQIMRRGRQPVLWAAAVALYLALLVAAVVAGPAVAGALGAKWSRLETSAVAAALLTLPGWAPLALALVSWLEGQQWLWEGRETGRVV